MDWKPVEDGALLTWATCTVRIVADPRGPGHVSRRAEANVEIDEAFVCASALLDVSLDEKLSTRLEQPRRFGKESIAHDPPLGVSLLPPWVREMDEDSSDRAIRAKTRQRLASVLGKNADPRGEPARLEPRADDRRPFAANLQADERCPRLDLGSLDEKPATARPDLELDPFPTRKQRNLDAAGRQARRVFVRSRRHGWTIWHLTRKACLGHLDRVGPTG
jgi:hypothetical protein